MSKAVLDTNIYRAYTVGDPTVLEALATHDVILFPVFVLGELNCAFRGGTKYEHNCGLLTDFLAKPRVTVAVATENTAEIYGSIMSALRRAGTPLPTNDVWIAAQAMEHGAVVVSYDRHFLQVPGLRVWPRLEFGRQV